MRKSNLCPTFLSLFYNIIHLPVIFSLFEAYTLELTFFFWEFDTAPPWRSQNQIKMKEKYECDLKFKSSSNKCWVIKNRNSNRGSVKIPKIKKKRKNKEYECEKKWRLINKRSLARQLFSFIIFDGAQRNFIYLLLITSLFSNPFIVIFICFISKLNQENDGFI